MSYRVLHRLADNKELRRATAAESSDSDDAAEHDNGVGAIHVKTAVPGACFVALDEWPEEGGPFPRFPVDQDKAGL